MSVNNQSRKRKRPTWTDKRTWLTVLNGEFGGHVRTMVRSPKYKHWGLCHRRLGEVKKLGLNHIEQKIKGKLNKNSRRKDEGKSVFLLTST